MIRVSVFMITYNHEAYIAQAIDGVLMQQTTFPFEIVIGDDASKDNTREILLGYQKKYPDKIRLILNSENVGMHQNFISTYRGCQGEYVAFCEGDDFWTDPHKLTKQVEFLDNNNGVILCFHDAIIYDDVNKLRLNRIVNRNIEFKVEINSLLLKNQIPTLTIMFRNNLLKEFPNWFFLSRGADRPLYFLLSNFGDLYYLPFVGACYRIHSESMTQKIKSKGTLERIEVLENRLNVYDSYNEFFKFRFDLLIQKIKKDIRLNLFNLYFFHKNYFKCYELITTKGFWSLNSLQPKVLMKILIVMIIRLKKNEG